MQFSKSILEAINRGISLALDDFDDDEPVQHIKSKQTNVDHAEINVNHIFNLIDNGKATKEDLNELVHWYKQTNLHYRVKSKKQLMDIIDNLSQISPNDIDLNWIDISNLTDLTRVFAKLKNLNIDCAKWDTRHVEKFNYIFAFSSNTTIKANNWQFDSAKEFDGMFYMCKTLNVEIDAEQWNSKNVKTMQNMFHGCTNRNLIHYACKLDISGCLNFSKMFADSKCDEDLPSWEIPNNIPGAFTEENMNTYGTGSMVYNCYIWQHDGGLPKIVQPKTKQLTKDEEFIQYVKAFCYETDSKANLNSITIDQYQRYNCNIEFIDGTSGIFKWSPNENFLVVFNLVILKDKDYYPYSKSLDILIKKCNTAIRKRLKIFGKNKEQIHFSSFSFK